MTSHHGVVLQHRLGFGIVCGQAMADDLLVSVIKAIVTKGALLEAGHQFVAVRAGEMEDPANLNMHLHEDGLGDITWDAVENEVITIGLELAGINRLSDRLMPESDGHLVGNELSLARIFEEFRTQLAGGVKRAKDISAGAMIEAGDLSKNLALSSLSTSGSSKNQNGTIACHE